jgi:hypothetical protein
MARTEAAGGARLLHVVAALAAQWAPPRAASRFFALDIKNGALIIAQPTVEPRSSGQA